MLTPSLAHRLTTLNVLRQGGREKPHKPALLLAIVTIADQGRLPANRVDYSPELVELFAKYLRAVSSGADAVNMRDPFWRLRTDGLLMPVAKPGHESAVELREPPRVSQIVEFTDGSRLDEELFDALRDAEARDQLRTTLVSRYFPDRYDAVQAIAIQESSIGDYERHLEAGEKPAPADMPVREQAFRRVVLRAYDYRCAACGVRVIWDDLVMVEAAHLVPWGESRDDDPCNGISLCRNHHWALDRYLLAPTTRRTWKVSKVLDDRIEGQRDLLDLSGRSLLLPRETRFHPKDEALSWREERLIRLSD